MIRAGFTFEHPTTKTRTVVLESDVETKGMGWMLEVTRYSKLGSDLGEHLHLTWTETFEIINGTAKYKLDGNERNAKAGESFVVEPGHFHVHPWNATDEELVYRQRDRFAQPSPAAVQDILGIFASNMGITWQAHPWLCKTYSAQHWGCSVNCWGIGRSIQNMWGIEISSYEIINNESCSCWRCCH